MSTETARENTPRFHVHVCPHCREPRDCNCVSEPETRWSVCDDCISLPSKPQPVFSERDTQEIQCFEAKGLSRGRTET